MPRNTFKTGIIDLPHRWTHAATKSNCLKLAERILSRLFQKSKACETSTQFVFSAGGRRRRRANGRAGGSAVFPMLLKDLMDFDLVGLMPLNFRLDLIVGDLIIEMGLYWLRPLIVLYLPRPNGRPQGWTLLDINLDRQHSLTFAPSFRTVVSQRSDSERTAFTCPLNTSPP